MKCLGFHPFFIEQQKSIYKTIEDKQSDRLYKAWADGADGEERYDNNYRDLFIELEGFIKDAMQVDRNDKHSRERGWTPPPKGYADKFEE